MSNVNQEKVAGVLTAFNNKFENKVANKKDNVSGDFSNDSVSYPTVRAMKSEDAILDGKITQMGVNLSSNLEITVEQQSTPETGFASTYVVKQGGMQVGSKINIMKDKMLRSISIETVGATPNNIETANNLQTGESYILMVVNTTDNDGTTNLVLPITDVFDLQTGDNSTITINSNGVISIKTGYVESVIDNYLDLIIQGL